MRMKKPAGNLVLPVLFLGLSLPQAAIFQPVLTGETLDGAQWADYDMDGDLDFAGKDNFGGNWFIRLYTNNGGTFTRQELPLPFQMDQPTLHWDDLDRNGSPDLLVTNEDNLPVVFSNNGDGTFTRRDAASTGLTGGFSGALVADFNHDGFPEVIAYGTRSIDYFKNDGSGGFQSFQPSGIPFAGMGYGAAGDLNKDGNMDLVQCTPSGAAFACQVYKGNGNLSFTLQTSAVLPSGNGIGTIELADYDGDGDLDIAMMTGVSTFLYRNDGSFKFTQVTNSGLGNMESGRIQFGDYDNDGLRDVIISGSKGLTHTTQLYRNQGATANPIFVPVASGIVSHRDEWLEFGDFDGDSKLDLLQSFDIDMVVLKNTSPTVKAAPGAPSGLLVRSSSINTIPTLSWKAPSSAGTTPKASLTYNIQATLVSSVPAVPLLTSLSRTDGRRLVPNSGNMGNLTSWKFGQPIFINDKIEFKAQAIDANLQPSAFSTKTWIVGGNLAMSRSLQGDGTINLTTSAATGMDWAHWGLTTKDSFTRSTRTVTSKIEKGTVNGTAVRISNSKLKFSWTDGTNGAAVTATPTGIAVTKLGESIEVTVPAESAYRTLRVYLGVEFAGATISAWMDDVPDAELLENFSVTTGVKNCYYQITFKRNVSATASKLHVQLIMNNDAGGTTAKVKLFAAALQP
jgi:hypothetical protein